MITVYDISLKVVQLVTDVLYGAATAGATTSLTDTNNLVQDDQYWDRGVLWVRSGTHSGKVLQVTGYVGSKLSFASLGATPIAANDRYAVTRGIYPWLQIVSAIQQALDETHVEDDDDTYTGDGTTLEFALPAGVVNVKRVEFEDTDGKLTPSHHWKVRNGAVRFDFGYAPYNGDVIHIISRAEHEVLTGYSTEISNEINLEWLKYKAAEKLLIWGAGMYGKNPEYLVEERMNIVLNNMRGKHPRVDGPEIMVQTAGA